MKLKTEINQYLKVAKLKPYQLADLVGVPRTCIYRFLKGERGLYLSTAEKIKSFLSNRQTLDN